MSVPLQRPVPCPWCDGDDADPDVVYTGCVGVLMPDGDGDGRVWRECVALRFMWDAGRAALSAEIEALHTEVERLQDQLNSVRAIVRLEP